MGLFGAPPGRPFRGFFDGRGGIPGVGGGDRIVGVRTPAPGKPDLKGRGPA